eukprot:4392403-Pleurochrysis_carterae.AAC.1
MPQHTAIANWIRADGLCQPACSFALQNVLLRSKVFEFDSIPSKNRLGPLNIAQQPPSQKFHPEEWITQTATSMKQGKMAWRNSMRLCGQDNALRMGNCSRSGDECP